MEFLPDHPDFQNLEPGEMEAPPQELIGKLVDLARIYSRHNYQTTLPGTDREISVVATLVRIPDDGMTYMFSSDVDITSPRTDDIVATISKTDWPIDGLPQDGVNYTIRRCPDGLMMERRVSSTMRTPLRQMIDQSLIEAIEASIESDSEKLREVRAEEQQLGLNSCNRLQAEQLLAEIRHLVVRKELPRSGDS